jgi:hypothetical protein
MRRVFGQTRELPLCFAVNQESNPKEGAVLNSHFKIFAVVAAMALLIPAAASAKRPEGKPDKGNKHGQSEGKGHAKEQTLKLASANLKGVVTSNDGATMTVMVEKASGHAKACKEMELTFDLSDARFHTADNNASGDMDALDFEVGHVVKVRTKLALLKGKKTTCGAAEELALSARAVHNRTTPQVEEDVDEVEEPDVDEVEEPDVEDVDEV